MSEFHTSTKTVRVCGPAKRGVTRYEFSYHNRKGRGFQAVGPENLILGRKPSFRTFPQASTIDAANAQLLEETCDQSRKDVLAIVANPASNSQAGAVFAFAARTATSDFQGRASRSPPVTRQQE